MTPFQAAQKFAKTLRDMGYVDAKAWTKEQVESRGWGRADAQVACEGADLVEMQLGGKGPFVGSAHGQPYKDVYCEPYSTWLMSFYADSWLMK